MIAPPFYNNRKTEVFYVFDINNDSIIFGFLNNLFGMFFFYLDKNSRENFSKGRAITGIGIKRKKL